MTNDMCPECEIPFDCIVMGSYYCSQCGWEDMD